jgi:hypothetical protein
LENQFTPHDLCDETHAQWVKPRVKAVLKTVDNKRIRENCHSSGMKLLLYLFIKRMITLIAVIRGMSYKILSGIILSILTPYISI